MNQHLTIDMLIKAKQKLEESENIDTYMDIKTLREWTEGREVKRKKEVNKETSERMKNIWEIY